MNKTLLRALNKYVDQAAEKVQEDEREAWHRAMALEQQQQQISNSTYWTIGSTTTPSQTTAGLYGTAGYNPSLGGAPSQQYWGGISQTQTRWPQHWSFTDEQMEKLLATLALHLAKGWECIRCHRVWNPQVTGCDVCNLMDRLEGKDVERDTAA